MSFSHVYCTCVQCTCRSMKRWEKRRWGTRHVLRWVVNVVVHLGGLTGRGILYKHTIAIFYSSAQDTWEGLWYDWSQFCWCLFLVWFVDSSVMFFVVDVICTLVCSVKSVLRRDALKEMSTRGLTDTVLRIRILFLTGDGSDFSKCPNPTK